MGVFKDFKELIAGLGITGKHLGRHAITIQYPEERWTMPERSRGTVVLLSDKETGELNCTACLLCMKACPTGAIVIKAPRNPETKKRELQSFTVDHSICCYCGLCQEACNFCAIKLATKYEFSTLDRDELVWDVHKLQENGRDVDYVDTRKKKPAPKPKPAATEKKTDPTEAPKSAPATKTTTATNVADAPPGNPAATNTTTSSAAGPEEEKGKDKTTKEGES